MAPLITLPRLPKVTDIPPHIHLSITAPPPESGPLRSALLLLHGLGDTNAPFTHLASQLRLPSTVILSVQAPTPLPAIFTDSDAPSFHWGDDVLFDSNNGDIDLDAGFSKAGKVVWHDVILDVLLRKCGFEARDVMVLGFGQGGMVGLAVAAAVKGSELGGVISIGGRLPSEGLILAPVSLAKDAIALSSSSISGLKSRTPVLLLGGNRSKEVTQSAVNAVKAQFGDVEYVKWAKNEDSMPKNRDEMLPLMRIFARRLGRMVTPGGTVEV